MPEKSEFSYKLYQKLEDLSAEDQQGYLRSIQAQSHADAPYSEFKVGVALRLEDGTVIEGSNQENAAFPSGMCAERIAFWKAATSHGGLKIEKVYVSATGKNGKAKTVPPCGACRQVMVEREIKQQSKIEVFFTGEAESIVNISSVSDLLPFRFDDKKL